MRKARTLIIIITIIFMSTTIATLSPSHDQTQELTTSGRRLVLSDQQIQNLVNKKIFFGHQSVGDNIVQGVRDLVAAEPRLKLSIVTSADPQSVHGLAFVEAHIGVNRDPRSKTAAFAAVLDKGFGAQGGVAMYKYCYIDFAPSTDVQQVFDRYHDGINELRRRYPSLTLVHSTVPLTAEESTTTMRKRVRNVLRKIVGRDPNVKRNQFNKLLRQTYAGKEPIFDIAEIESTRSDGSRSYFRRGFQKIYTLASEYTNDGGHLNESGRRAAAEKLLVVLATL